jgi:hypothetical protein
VFHKIHLNLESHLRTSVVQHVQIECLDLIPFRQHNLLFDLLPKQLDQVPSNHFHHFERYKFLHILICGVNRVSDVGALVTEVCELFLVTDIVCFGFFFRSSD